MDILNNIKKATAQIVAAALSVAMQACMSDFNPGLDEEPVVVINMLAVAGNPLSVGISHSWLHIDGIISDATVTDARVTFAINGQPGGLMKYNAATKCYEADYLAASGDEIVISAVSEKYGAATGSTHVPSPVKIEKWSFNPVVVTDYNGLVLNDSLSYLTRLNIEYSITFHDPAGEENYYMVSGRPYYDTGGGFSSDPIISENNTPLDAILSKNNAFVVFSDRSINGQTYTLRYTCSYIPFIPVQELGRRITDRITLCSISRDYYYYLLSIHKKYGELNLNFENMGLTEPKIIFSNVSTGAGVVASQSTDSIVNDVHDIVCKFAGLDPDLTFPPAFTHESYE